MPTAHLLLGSNEGNREATILSALSAISLLKATKITQQSLWYETASWGNTALPPHINMAIEIETAWSASQLLEQLLTIEHHHGRTRTAKWGQRILDIDIIFYDHEVINTTQLVIPHPLMQDRRFVLQPLNDIIPNVKHPIIGKTVSELLTECSDQLSVQRYTPANLLVPNELN